MYNSASIIMSHNDKKSLICGLNESDIPNRDEVVSEAVKRIASVPNDMFSLTDEILRNPDSCVLMDLIVGDRDAMSFIKDTKRKLGQSCPEFIVMCEFVSVRLERELYGAGASAVISRQTPPLNVWAMLCDCADRRGAVAGRDGILGSASCVEPGELEIMVTDIMHKIGVPAHIKGYQYLRCAIISVVIRPEIINAVTKELYPGVAESFCTTPSRVERAIRHAIEVAWDRGDIDFLCSYFGSTIHNSRGKPTNSEFIAMIADKLRMTLRAAS